MRAFLLVFVLFGGLGLAHGQGSATERLLQTAIGAQQRGDFKTAIRDYRRVLAVDPDMAAVKVNLGAALVHEGQFDAAIAEYRSALPALKGNSEVLLDLALAYYKKGDWKDAHTQFEAVHALRPADARVALLLGETDLRLGQYPDAVALLSPMQAEGAHNPDFEYVLGSSLIATGKKRDGARMVEKSAASTNSADAYMLAGATLLALNSFADARRDLDAALRLNPELPGIYTLVGKARDMSGDAEGAEPVFREAVKRNPADFEANLYLGSILLKQRHLPQAKVYLDKALQLNPASFLARYEVGMLESTSGQDAAAAQMLAKLAEDDPDWLAPHVELATLYYRLHRPADGAKERAIVQRLNAAQQAQGPGR